MATPETPAGPRRPLDPDAQERLRACVDRLSAAGYTLHEALQHFERAYLHRALEQTGGNRTVAARLLGIHRNTLLRRLARVEG